MLICGIQGEIAQFKMPLAATIPKPHDLSQTQEPVANLGWHASAETSALAVPMSTALGECNGRNPTRLCLLSSLRRTQIIQLPHE